SLIPLSRGSFDVLVGMDRLSKRKFGIVCHGKVVRIPLEGDEILQVHGERTQGVVKTLMNTKTKVSYDLVIFREEHQCCLLRRGAWSSFEVRVGITKEGEVVKFQLSNSVCSYDAVALEEVVGRLFYGAQLGPFEILERISPVAYRLRLPEELSGLVLAGQKVFPAGIDHISHVLYILNRERDPKGNIMILPPVSVEEHFVVHEDKSIRTIFVQSLPRVSELEGLHKGYDRFQKILSQLNQMQVKPGQLKLVNISFSEHFNFLVTGWVSYPDQSHSTTFTSASSKFLCFSQLIENVLHSFVAESDPQQQITYEDFDQIGKLDLEELDIKWQMAMLSVRINRFEKKVGRKMKFNNKDAARFDKKKYSSFKLKELDKSEEPKALLSVDSMLNWPDHEGEDVEMGRVTQTQSPNGFAILCLMGKSSSSKTNEPFASAPSSDQQAIIFNTLVGLAIITKCIWMREDGELLLSPQQVVLGEFKGQICNGDPRTMENPHKNRDLGIVDSGCSRSMTGNKEKLDDFVKIVGGTVTFGGGDGKITGKGTIRTSKLNFENVYYVEELQNFNLFSVSQICDTKNKVLFTDKECLVLSKEFQLPENSQVVLRVPRRNNLYCFNLSDIKPERDVTCLLAKASLVESTKWHRRMAHVNFKNMNKLAKHGLVNGLPSKLFTNEHNCVACNKGKQHKASYKAITAVSTISAPLQLLHMDLFGPTSIRSIDHKYYSLVVTDDFSRVLLTKLHNKTPYELVSGKVPNISHLKPFGCLVTILNTSDHLGKFEGKADEGFIVGYAAHSKAYRVYNLSSKKIEETLNLRYLEDKPNVQGLGHEWYFDLDYLTDSLGYTRFKTNQPAGTQDTNIHAGTQADSDSECDEQVIVVPSFPSNSFSGTKVNEASDMVESSSDYAEELARLQKQAYEANATAEKHLSQADLATSRNRVPAGKVDSAAGVTDGPTDPSTPVFKPVHTAAPSLPPGHSLGSSEHSSRYPSPSDLANSMSSFSEMEDIHHHSDTGIFSSSSYDDDFGGTVTNLAPSVVVDSVPTKRVNTIHPQSQILGDLTSPVQTRGTLKKSKFGASAFVSYVHDQQRNNHTDYLHCLFACFLSQLEPSSVAQALNDPAWIEAMQEEMQQFVLFIMN
ncbi:ribonuclease H-like domain-containing protein, partial [Tanacetum coccineum]